VSTDSSPQEFDESRARRFVPRDDHAKTAVLVETTDEHAITSIRSPFGEQTMRGPFYAVAEGDASYGAARTEFEATHERVGPSTWRKSAAVLAYQVDEPSLVHTDIGETRETSNTAMPGDWIVRQHTGEVMVITPASFAQRYRAAD
jgi:hypothetical protein